MSDSHSKSLLEQLQNAKELFNLIRYNCVPHHLSLTISADLAEFVCVTVAI